MLDLMRNCVVCGAPMDPVITAPNHPSCIMFAEPGDEDSFTNLIKSTLTDIITEHDRRSPRSVQVKIGPSEMGDLCDRKVAYRLANIPACNEPDNWPAIVGTACHSWLEGAITQSTRAGEFITEKTLHIEQFVEGHSDLYWHTQQLVIDWKAQPLSEPVLTPEGWSPMGKIQVGDHVIGPTGKAVKVTGVYPLGAQEVFIVKTSDGGWTEATADHLWEIRATDKKRSSKIMTTAQLEIELKKRSPWYRLLPAISPVEFSPVELPMDPYALGLLLGDGGLSQSSVRFTNSDGLEQFLGFEISKIADKPGKAPSFGVHGAIPLLRELGLMGHLSIDKFIPGPYLLGRWEDRLALLQGLMDTDGYVQKGHATFSTSSDRLATDFIQLVQSLGGKTFHHRDKKLRKGATRHASLIVVKMPPGMCPFRAEIPHKKGRWRPGRHTHERVIKSVTPSRYTEVQCIKIDSPDGLYVTRDFLVTHNTMGPDKIRKTRKEGPEPGYVVQAHLYGYGFEQTGLPVKRVALACLPRAGWLRDMYVWWAEYDRSIAETALNRMFGLARQILDLDILKESHGYRWEQIPAVPSNNCGLCPYYDPGRPQEFGANETGCPGR